MSYIDIFNHNVIGEIAEIPLYYTFQADRENGEFQCKADSFILGGGSGEHSAVVITNLEYIIGFYLSELFDKNELTFQDLDNEILDLLMSNESKAFDFRDWSISEYVELNSFIQNHPINEEYRAEQWLYYELGRTIVEHEKFNPYKELSNKLLNCLK